ncbi:MAG: DnaJ domain-containing protein [Gammaproteobacteria bacterium]|jgi:curved DNA-binding protein|nr:DnaJ domain-containing protein [Gammaproteobacteria bacterium]MBT3488787.1 DnaJ domain-containing protein [Gammaproteobacteria bacterium]MBT3717683.1 DnaJ domain-containing protein [Gammaproteobacteria bacterium]MBT3844713.1 DnaJ domain-containing protein [Gammaproteobacteria bacterium]MBT3892298.1 DnaJ domain-containing protein [Gammaproteobacteria bacterium]
MEYHDYYKTLELKRDDPQDEVKKQYRRLARKYHPDVSKEPNAEQRFKEIAEAYEVLKDPEKRRSYDQLGANWKAGQEFRPPPDWEQAFGGRGAHFGGGNFNGAGAGGFSDFFESVFGGNPQNMRGGGFHRQPQPPPSQTLKITIQLQESYQGGRRTIQIPKIAANGQATGERKKLDIRIPKGIQTGQKIRLAGQGRSAMPGGPQGDLLLEVQFETDSRFELEGHNIRMTLPIAPWEAALGGRVTVPTLGGNVELKIAAGSQSGQKMRLKGRGLPGKPNGDQFITLQIQTPPAENETLKQIYQTLQQESHFNPRSDFESNP